MEIVPISEIAFPEIQETPLGTYYALEPTKRHQSISLNKFPSIDKSGFRWYRIEALRLGMEMDPSLGKNGIMPSDALVKAEVIVDGKVVNRINNDELLINCLTTQTVPSIDGIDLPIDLTGFLLDREHEHDIRIEFTLRKSISRLMNIIKLYAVMVGVPTRHVNPIGYIQRGFVGSHMMKSGNWVPLDLEGLVVRYHLVSERPFALRRLVHDSIAITLSVPCREIDQKKYLSTITYDTPINPKRYDRNAVYLEFESDDLLPVSIYVERITHNFYGKWALEAVVDELSPIENEHVVEINQNPEEGESEDASGGSGSSSSEPTVEKHHVDSPNNVENRNHQLSLEG